MKRLNLFESRLFGRICYGFGRDEEGFVYIKEDEANVVQMIFEMVINGHSLQNIQAELFNKGIKSPSGKDTWTRDVIDKTINHPRFYVLGTEGTMEVTDWDGTCRVVTKLCDDEGWGTEIKKVKAGPTKTMAPRDPSTVKVTELTEPEGIEDNLDPVYRQLVDAIEGAELKIKPEQTLRVVKVMEAAFESHETKQVIHLDV